jgi:NAD(P)-dependent dehydrogenase (short-subunit alcohol dehydrogenase family)
MSLLSRLISPPQCRSVARLARVIRGKTVLITGASFGIGEATALLLSRAGAEVILIARSAEKLDSLVAQIVARGGKAHAYPADLYKVTDAAELIRHVEAKHPRLDLVVCNAGKSIRRRITEQFDRDDLERSLALNFSSPAALITALLPRMLAQGGGQIISVSTVSAKQPGAPRWGTYQGSKAGFDLWLRSVACELRPQGIRVSSVYMPLVRTRMSAASGLYDRVPALSSSEAAEVIAYAIVRGADRVAPWWLVWGELLTLLFSTPINRLLTLMDQRMP